MFRKTLLAIVCFVMLCSVTLGEFQQITFDNIKHDPTLEIILRERLSRTGSTFTFSNGLTLDNATNNALTITENSEDLILTFGTDKVALSSSTGLAEVDFASIFIEMAEISAPANPGANTGRIYVADNGGTTTLYFRDSSGNESSLIAGAGTPAGADTQMQYNNNGAFGAISTIIWDDTNLEFANDQSAAFGTAADWTVNFDDSVDDQLIWLSAATTAGATTDPLYEIIVGASPTANQQVFGVAKGTQSSNTALFTVDEDGDGEFAGSLTLGSTFYQQAIASAAAGNVNLTIDASGTGTITIGGISTGLTSFPGSNVDIGNAATDKLSITAEVDTNLTLDDDSTDSPALILSDAGDATATFVKKNGATSNTEITIAAASDLEIVAGNLAVGNGSPGTAAMDGEDFYVNGDAEFDGAVQFDGLPTGAAGLTITGAAVSLNVSSNFATNINTGTSTGAITLGGGSGTFAIASTGLDLSTAGALSNVTDITMTGDVTMANGKVIKGSTTDAQTIALQVYDNDTGPGYKDAILLTNGNTPAIAIGDNNPTVAIDSSDWDISTTGAMSGIGAITADGLITAQLGATVTGATTSVNASSNFATNINTGTSTGATSIGNALNNITLAGHIQGTNALLFDGSTADNGNETTLAITDPTGDNTMTIGDDSGSVAYTPTAGTTKDASDAAIPVTHAYVAGTSGAASAWSLPNGENGQVLTVAIITDGGVATITPDTANSGWATAVLTDDGDTISFLYVDDTVGWVITGMIGIAGQPVITQ